MYSKEIGIRLMQLRGDRSQEEMGNTIGVSRSAWAMYEQGKRIPRDAIKVKIAKHFKTTVQSIFFDSKGDI